MFSGLKRVHSMCQLVTSIMIATKRRWQSIYKARCCWRLSACSLLLKLLHSPYHIKLDMWKFLQVLAGPSFPTPGLDNLLGILRKTWI